ncbi:MAG: sulfate permease [Proteobacteria bacterium]|nr:sulfate permease [Pseudomonadota bacterium]MDA1057751.1 sulfate permease [Pseudomonadota bacterium]
MSRFAGARRFVPILNWLPRYAKADLPGDMIAGGIVAVMLVPQAMAYAMLAGLPPQVGLYASILPLIAYAALGSSRALAVGPVAIASLMTASALGAVAESGTVDYVAAALILAALSGLILLAMGVARLGVLVNFLSHQVISGFTSAAALVIGLSQLKHLLGIDVPRGSLFTDVVVDVIRGLPSTNLATALVGAGAIGLLILSRAPLARLLRALRVPRGIVAPLTKTGPLAAVFLTALVVWAFGLDADFGVAIVGTIPAGLPHAGLPRFDAALWTELFPAAVLITIIGFLESVSVAKALASKRRQKIDANQELLALGAANIAASVTGGYPVAGGFGRSGVNFAAGANTPLASIITAVLMALTLLFLTPLFYYLPRTALAAIIIVAVLNLIDLRTFREAWRYNKADAVSLAATFVSVLVAGVEAGIVFGLAVSLALYLWRTSRPHIAVVGRVGETEHFRNVLRHTVKTAPGVLAIRVDESLYFANASYLEDHLLSAVADDKTIEQVVLICSAVNFIDASALDTLENMIVELRDAGVTLHLAEVKGPVTDKLQRTAFLEHLKPGSLYLSTHDALRALTGTTRAPRA